MFCGLDKFYECAKIYCYAKINATGVGNICFWKFSLKSEFQEILR